MYHKKYRAGDLVLLLNDLSQIRSVVKVWVEKSYGMYGYSVYFTEKVALNDNTILTADDLTFYSRPLKIMAIQMEILKKEIELLKRKTSSPKKCWGEKEMAEATMRSKLKCKKCGTKIEVIIYTKKLGEKWWCSKCKKNVRSAILTN